MKAQASAEAVERQSQLQMERNLRVQVYICLHMQTCIGLYMSAYGYTRNAFSASRSIYVPM